MVNRGMPHLSKSRFTAGLQCLKRLYLECYAGELRDPVDDGLQHRFDVGNQVGELAQRRFPGGRLVEASYREHERAVIATRDLLSASLVPPLYEAAFEAENIKIRADVLRPNGNGFDLIEVKSTTKFDDAKHKSDVAIQLYALERSGLPVNRAFLMHLNKQYVYQGGDYDLEALFELTEVTSIARDFAAEQAPAELAKMWTALAGEQPPDIETGDHCKKPYQCPFYAHCHQAELPSSPPNPADAYFSPELGELLAQIRYPVSFLDFETFMPALPLYRGTRPYQTIPFQWSLHIQPEEGDLIHLEFLNDDADDPRERLILSLLQAIPATGSIIVYSPYEKRMLNELSQAFPEYGERLADLIERLYDLLPLARKHYDHPAIASKSLKSVLPALVPNWGYADLAIQDGMLAAIKYVRLLDSSTPKAERGKIRQELLDYCARDTEATVKVLKAFREAAVG